jgi:HlyD family secretion protein
VLVRLDDRVMGVDATFSALSVDQLLAQQARLEAERIGGATINFPATLTARKTDGAQRAMADETALFRTKTSEYARLEAQLQARIRQYGQEISADNAQIAALEQQQRLLVPERAGVQTLWAKKLVTIGKLNQLERTAADIEGQIGAFHAKIAQSNAQITEVRERILQLAQTRRSDAGTQLAQVNAALNQQLVRSATATDAFDRSIIRAPYDGVVDKLAFTTIGGVIRPAEVIMELVPVRDRLLVEGMVSPSDIDRVQVGQPARVRFTAFSVTDSLELPGKVSFVAAERTTERDTQHSYYTVRVEIDQAELKRNAAKQLKPGMPAEIYVSTGNRSMLSYITKPMRDQFARAFRDS